MAPFNHTFFRVERRLTNVKYSKIIITVLAAIIIGESIAIVKLANNDTTTKRNESFLINYDIEDF